MKLFRKKTALTGRQRLRDPGEPAQSFSYHASRRSEEETGTGRQLQKERGPSKKATMSFWRFWAQRLGLIVLLVALVVSSINILSLSSNAKVLPLTSGASGSFLRSQATYQAAANKILAGSLWNHNKITIDTASFSRQMVAQFPELSSVSVTLPLLAHRPVVYLQPAQPAVILTASNGSFVLDTTGKALLLSTNLPPGRSLPLVTDQSGLQVKPNHQILTPNDISFIQMVTGQLAARHFTVTSMDLPPAASELDVHLASQPYFVKFNLQNNDPRQQAGTFLATIATLQRKNVTPAHYVDVRVDGRAYYQ